MSGPLLTVREEESVSLAVEEAVAKFPFAEEAFFAAKWRIVHDLKCGDLIPGTNRRVVFVVPNKLAKSPGLLVRYYEGKDADGYPLVVVDWIQYFEYDEGQASISDAFVANL
jgi:hypothetical protein